MVAVWILLIYAMGVILTFVSTSNSLEYNNDPMICIMWPMLLFYLLMDWMEEL